ncbi:MAG: alpha-ketoacid dehydrogenase subunit beta [Clostridia bacterium]
MPEMNLIQAVNSTLDAMLASDERVVVLGEDVGKNGGVFRATDGLFDKYGGDRVMDTPLAESGIIGTSIGLAIGGLRPIAEIQFMGFLYPGLDQLISHGGRMAARSGGQIRVPLVVRVPYGGGIRAPEQHADSAEAYLVHTPGLKVVVPSTPYDAKGLLYAALHDPDPVVFMEPIRLYRMGRQEVPAEAYVVPIGSARIVREGSDVSVVTWGNMVAVAERAAESLAGEASVEVLDLRSLFPLDRDTIARSVNKTGRAVVLQEAPLTAGLGGEVAAIIQETAFWSLEAPVARVAGPDVPYPPYAWEDMYLPTPERLVQAIRRTLQD